MDSLESRIAYQFKQPALLEEALTHPSFTLESKPPHRHNQRLEFLGDAVLQLVLSETLFHRFPLEDEGLLTKHRSRLVQNRPLAAIATRLSLGQAIRLGKGTETIGGRTRESILADAMESVIGAVYLDGGLDAARRFILHHWVAELEGLRLSSNDPNSKGQLQELLQGQGGLTPTYRTTSEGPAHEKRFEAVVLWRGRDLATGTGRTKKEAESDAAQKALKLPEMIRLLPKASSQGAS